MCLCTLPLQSLGSVRFFKEMSPLIQNGHIKLLKSDSKDFYNVTNYLFFKYFFLLNFPFIKES